MHTDEDIGKLDITVQLQTSLFNPRSDRMYRSGFLQSPNSPYEPGHPQSAEIVSKLHLPKVPRRSAITLVRINPIG